MSRRLVWSVAGAGLLALGASSCTSADDGAGVASDASREDAASDDASIEAAGPHSVVAIPLIGCTQGAYLAKVDIGSQTFQLELDTGSTTSGVASAKCKSCGVLPLYAPGPQ